MTNESLHGVRSFKGFDTLHQLDESPCPDRSPINIKSKDERFHMSKLPHLEQRIKQKIQEAKESIHPAHNRIYTQSLIIEIQTLNWVLNEIRSFSRKS